MQRAVLLVYYAVQPRLLTSQNMQRAVFTGLLCCPAHVFHVASRMTCPRILRTQFVNTEYEKLNNANGLGNFKNKKGVFDFLRKPSGDFFFKLETH